MRTEKKVKSVYSGNIELRGTLAELNYNNTSILICSITYLIVPYCWLKGDLYVEFMTICSQGKK
jgi:hypothetical protein